MPLTFGTFTTTRTDIDARSGNLAARENATGAALNELGTVLGATVDGVEATVAARFGALEDTPAVSLAGAGATVNAKYPASNVTITAAGTITMAWPSSRDTSTIVRIIQGGAGGFTPTFAGVTWITALPVWSTMATGDWKEVRVFKVSGVAFAEWVGRDDTWFMYASSDLARQSTTTPTTDSVFSFSAPPNSVIVITGLLVFSSADVGDTADLKMTLSVPGGASGWWTTPGHGSGATADPSTIQLEAYAVTSGNKSLGLLNAKVLMMDVRWVVITAGTGGTVALQWSQNSSVAFDTTRKAGSYLEAVRKQ